MQVVYEVSKNIEKTFFGGVFHSWKFSYQFVFSDLTLEDRLLLNLRLTKQDKKGNEIELSEEEIPNEIVGSCENCPPLNTHEKIVIEIIDRMERKLKSYQDTVIVVPNEKVALNTVNDKFKTILTTISDLTAGK